METDFEQQITIAIPARYASERFPGKIISPVGGLPLIVRVYQSVARNFNGQVVVLPDDKKIVNVLEQYAVPFIMTSPSCRSGTQRIASVINQLNGEYIINVQGDEPLITAELAKNLAKLLYESAADIATLARPETSFNVVQDPNLVKVVLDKKNMALYFSRSVIPYPRDALSEWLVHVGIYGYRRKFLEAFENIRFSSLENAEKLEQLSFLYEGKKIIVGTTDFVLQGVDVPEDIKKVEHILKEQGKL